MSTTKDELKRLREEVERLQSALLTSRRDAINARVSHPEALDPTPLAVPVEHQGPPSMEQLVQQYVASAFIDYAKENDMETFAEADDFEAEDEEVLNLSGFEVSEFPMEEEYPESDPPPAVMAPPEPPQAEPAPAEKQQ